MLETLIPLYCLTGFVGSGKTTALLSILRQNPDKKIGVIFTEPPLLHRQNIQENEDISIEMLDNGSLQCSCSEDAPGAGAGLHAPLPAGDGVCGGVRPVRPGPRQKNSGERGKRRPDAALCGAGHHLFNRRGQLHGADSGRGDGGGASCATATLRSSTRRTWWRRSCWGCSRRRSTASTPTATSSAAPTAASAWSCWSTTCSPTPPARRRMRMPDACPTRSCSTASTACRGTRWSPSSSASSRDLPHQGLLPV